ncbi:hypothetical protein [Bradyrhizobium sp. WSM1743]|uniref:hypothetical protein n=1 Tax=Bradyrhizobium sp. WSM1743 TaxID=318996 RepID=UPI00048468A2|nr:hypothetical protein [Bradyrhizobium sp. WSM1743]
MAYLNAYFPRMRTAYELCRATSGKQVPSAPDWIHEVKHDGCRMPIIRENERVRLLSRSGTDWTKRSLDRRGRAEERGERVRRLLPVGRVKLAQIAGDALPQLSAPPLHLRLCKVLVPITAAADRATSQCAMKRLLYC